MFLFWLEIWWRQWFFNKKIFHLLNEVQRCKNTSFQLAIATKLYVLHSCALNQSFMNCRYLYKILIHFSKIKSSKIFLLHRWLKIHAYLVKLFLKTLFWENVLIFYKDIYNSWNFDLMCNCVKHIVWYLWLIEMTHFCTFEPHSASRKNFYWKIINAIIFLVKIGINYITIVFKFDDFAIPHAVSVTKNSRFLPVLGIGFNGLWQCRC